jgi:hypothetical protein
MMAYESLPIDASPATNLPELPNAPRSASASSNWRVPEHRRGVTGLVYLSAVIPKGSPLCASACGRSGRVGNRSQTLFAPIVESFPRQHSFA